MGKRAQPSEDLNLPEKTPFSKMSMKLFEMREKGEQCDVSIICEGRHLKAHRVILSAGSEYFRNMFNSSMVEANKKEIAIPGINYKTMEKIIRYIYKSEIRLTTENAQNILIAANFLQMTDLVQLCETFIIKRIDVGNCVSMRQLMVSTNCNQKIVKQATNFIKAYFQQIVKHDSFIQLEFNELIDLLSIDGVCSDSEELVCLNAIKWLQAKTERSGHAFRVLQCICLSLLTSEFKSAHIDNNPIFNQDDDCLKLINNQSTSVRSRECLKSILAVNSSGPAFSYNPSSKEWAKKMDGTKECSRIIFHGQCLFTLYLHYIDPKITFNMYDFFTEQWKMLPTLRGIDPLRILAVVVVENKLYVFLRVDFFRQCIKIFDIARNLWMDGPEMFDTFSDLAIAAIDKNIYVFETSSPRTPAQAKKLDTSTNIWTDIAPTMERWCRCSVATFNGKIYLAGVEHCKFPFGDLVEVYDPETNKMTSLNRWYPGPFSATLVATSEGIYAFGKIIYFYNVETDIWRTERIIPEKFASSAMLCAVPDFMLGS